MKGRFRRWLRILAINVAILVVLLEIGLRLYRVDHRLVAPLLYYQAADLPVHEARDDAELLFGMKPGARWTSPDGRRISINALGFRDVERSVEKAPGVFRIVVLGGSNAYGAAVNDGETYAAYLEARLNARGGRPYEVWNLGTCAYVKAQEVALARWAMRELAPDLFFFGPDNPGRRAFLQGSDPGPLLDANPALYFENLKTLPLGELGVGRWLVAHSALWRTIALAWNRSRYAGRCAGAVRGDCGPPASNPRYDSDRFTNDAAFQAFWAEFGGRVPMVFMPSRPGIDFGGPAPPVIDLFAHLPFGADAAYRDWHPPARVYRWYAEVIERALDAEALLPPRGAPPPSPSAAPSSAPR